MITTAVIIAYLVIALGATRPLYGRYRACAIKYNENRGDLRRQRWPVETYEAEDRIFTIIASGIAGLFWPIPALYYAGKPIVLRAARAFVWWVNTSRTRSAYEIRQAERQREAERAEREAQLRRRIAELERINGITS